MIKHIEPMNKEDLKDTIRISFPDGGDALNPVRRYWFIKQEEWHAWVNVPVEFGRKHRWPKHLMKLLAILGYVIRVLVPGILFTVIAYEAI